MMKSEILAEHGEVVMRELSSAEIDGVAGGMSVQSWIQRTVKMVNHIVNDGATCDIDAEQTITCQW